jgi:hypothetical protein
MPHTLLTSGDQIRSGQQSGMIVTVSLRLLYFVFQHLR